jgi:ATP-dependent helicase/nuclease subunit A
MSFGDATGADQVIEGIIDLIFREEDGWVIVDFKTDTISDPEIKAGRVALYRKQLDLYSACWEQMTGEKVKLRILQFTEDATPAAW